MNLAKLRGKLVECGFRHKDLAAKDAWNLKNVCSVSQKLNGTRPITIEEARIVAKMCNFTLQEYKDIFFND